MRIYYKIWENDDQRRGVSTIVAEHPWNRNVLGMVTPDWSIVDGPAEELYQSGNHLRKYGRTEQARLVGDALVLSTAFYLEFDIDCLNAMPEFVSGPDLFDQELPEPGISSLLTPAPRGFHVLSGNRQVLSLDQMI